MSAEKEAFLAGYAQAIKDTAYPVLFDGGWMDRRDLYPEDRADEFLEKTLDTPPAPRVS